MFHTWRIAPELFDLVEFPGFGHHDVYHYVHVIDEYPLLRLAAFVAIGQFAAFLFDILFHKIGDCSQLGGIAGLANNEEIRDGFRYLPEVKAYDVLTFLLLDGMNDGLENFAVSV